MPLTGLSPRVLGALLVASLATASTARADDLKEQCAQAYEDTQNLRRDGKLVEARARARVCLEPRCPASLRGDCATWFDEIERSMPTVVFSARDASGQSLVDVDVSMDGAPLTRRLDGLPVAVDPGVHAFELREAGGARTTVRLLVPAGAKDVRVAGVLDVHRSEGSLAARSSSSDRGPSWTLPVVFGSVSLLAAGSFAFFGLTGKADEADLERTCAPRCSDAQTAPVYRRYVVADVSLLVGIVSAVATGYFVSRSLGAPEARRASRR
jgi:hypothetical protein